MKKWRSLFGICLFAALLSPALCTLAESVSLEPESGRIETDGVAFEIPAELKELVTVETEDQGDGVLVNVYETASVEAAKAQGEDREGAGWLFGISRLTQDRVRELRCGGMDGMEVFASDGDDYLIYDHPTDVRFVREQYDDIEEDMQQWSKLNEWAFENVRDEILANNSELKPAVFTNTTLDMFLAQAAYRPDTNFEIRSLDYGVQDPKAIEENTFIEDLAENFVYDEVYDQETPDGEYIVLNFEDENLRFDFFQAEEGHNLIREIMTIDGEEAGSTLFAASLKETDDTSRTTTDIMRAWCEAFANAGKN